MNLDLDALHALLTLRADDRGVVRVHQTELAVELCTTKLVVHHALEAMIRQGRLRKITEGTNRRSVRHYEVVAPMIWRATVGVISSQSGDNR